MCSLYIGSTNIIKQLKRYCMKIKSPEHLKDTVRYLGMSYVEYARLRHIANMLNAKSIHINAK